MVHNFENHVFHAWEIKHFDDEFQTVLDGHPQVDIIFVIVLATEHQVEIQVMWGRSVNLEMMYEIIEHLWRESLNIFNYEQNWSFPRIHFIFIEKLFYAVKCLFLKDVGLHLLLLHDLGDTVIILTLISGEELPFVIEFFLFDFLMPSPDDFLIILTALFIGRS